MKNLINMEKINKYTHLCLQCRKCNLDTEGKLECDMDTEEKP